MQLTLVKIGSDCRPASSQDIKDVKELVRKGIDDLKDGEPLVLVTHHNVKIEQYYIDDREIVAIGEIAADNRRAVCGELTPHKRRPVKIIGGDSALCNDGPCCDTGPCESEPL